MRGEKGKMRRFVELTLIVFLFVAAPVYAQTPDQPAQPGSTSESANQQQAMSVIGKITEIDLARGTLALDNGMHFALAPNFEFTSAPALGQEVEVIYEQQGSQSVVHSVDSGFEGQSHD